MSEEGHSILAERKAASRSFWKKASVKLSGLSHAMNNFYVSGDNQQTLEHQKYVYKPLPARHIRLLRITGIPNTFQIDHVTLDSVPQFSAISYTWNGESFCHVLRLTDGLLSVTLNISNALPSLIAAAKTQALWIDAICINQQDTQEKAVQIPLMQEIYTMCRECLVWLGPSTPVSDIAIDATPRICQQIAEMPALQVWEAEDIAVSSPDALASPLWRGIVDIFSRPWFSRVWTFQEAVLPTLVSFVCGSKTVRFDDAAKLAPPLLVHLTALQHSFPDAGLDKLHVFVGFLKTMRTVKSRALVGKDRTALDTLKAIYYVRPWQSTHRLDRVYGVLGLADPALQKDLVIDYSKTAEELSQDMALWYITNGSDLYLLNLASSLRENGSTLPSWIPNLTRIGSHWCIGIIWHRFRDREEQQHRDSSNPRYQRVEVRLEWELHVSGFRLDIVSKTVSWRKANATSEGERCKAILNWEKKCLALSMSLYDSENGMVPEAHWTTILSAICDKHLPPSVESYQQLKVFLHAASANTPLPAEQSSVWQAISLQIRRLHRAMMQARFFATGSSSIGIGPRRLRAGDQICVLYSGCTPFIIRPLSPEDLRWTLVGDAYVFGAMGMSPIVLPDETFVLV